MRRQKEKPMQRTEAFHQWAKRPQDERFWSIPELARHLDAEAEQTIIPMPTPSKALRVIAQDGDVKLQGANLSASLTNWSFGQLCQRASAPGSYLAQLPATLATQNLNHGLSRAENGKTSVLLRNDGENGTPNYTVRALTSGVYQRVPDRYILQLLEPLLADGWRVPPARPAFDDPRARPATQADVLDSHGMLSVRVGDMIAPAGVYRGDRDMFLFLINEKARIQDGTDEGLSRAVMIANSEVGARSLWVLMLLLRHVCGNHICHGVTKAMEIRLRHVGSVRSRARWQLSRELKSYSQSSAGATEEKIKKAQNYIIGKDKAEIIEELFGRRRISSKQVIGQAFDLCEANPVDGNPTSAWGVAQGMTRAAQNMGNADARVEHERAAGKVLEIAF